MIDSDQFAARLIMDGLADSTVRNYRCLYQRWLDWCRTHDRDPERLEPMDVRGWSQTIHGSRPMTDQAAAVVNHACRMHDVEESGSAIPKPRRPKRSPRSLSDDAAARLAATAHEAGIGGTACLVCLYTAARRSETAGMEWHNVGSETIRWWRPKTRDWHEIPLHPVLAEHLECRRGGQWLFPGRWGGHVSPATIWRWVIDVAEQAGIGHVTPHQLRATALTVVNENTGDLRAAQELAGHTDVQTTTLYTRVSERRLTAAVGALDY